MSHSASAVAGFIDIATYDEIEKYLYGGDSAITYFVRQTQKCTWFTQIPVKLTSGSGQTEFGKEFSFHVSRSGDYLLNSWLRVKLNKLDLNFDATTQKGQGKEAVDSSGNPLNTDLSYSARFTTNFMHNLVKKMEIKFNDLSAHEVKSHHMDFWRNFSIPRTKRDGYNKMIGNVPAVSQWATVGADQNNASLGGVYLNLPLPLFYERDSGSALPTAALPYNDMRIHFELRDWKELILVDQYGENDAYEELKTGVYTRIPNEKRVVPAEEKHFKAVPKLSNVELWANYAIVSSQERTKMGEAGRDIIIEQVQHSPVETFELPQDGQKHYDLRFSHAVKGIFFGVRNKSVPAELSNYTADTPPNPWQVKNAPYVPEKNVIKEASLIYENTTRLGSMGVDYYTLVNPFYHAESDGTDQPGVCMYSYAIDLVNHDPMGSTNFGKLTNVTLTPVSDVNFTNVKSDFLATVVNHNVIRIAGGALGFPVL